MISVAVKGYGIVIWDDADGWRTFGVSDALSAVLSDRVESVLQAVPIRSDELVCEALMSLTGAHLLAQSCDHGPGECDQDVDLN
jgi:hypothetical protein